MMACAFLFCGVAGAIIDFVTRFSIRSGARNLGQIQMLLAKHNRTYEIR